MKKLFMMIALAFGANTLLAQDIDEIKKYAYLGQFAKAKELVDKYLAVEKNAKKSEGWFYKGYVYNMASKDSAKTLVESDVLKTEALAALKKYKELDNKAELLAEQNNAPFFDIYSGYASDLGIKAYNKKDLASAFDYFKKALVVHDYIFSNNIIGANGYKFAAMDTILTLYTAIAGVEAKQQDEAMTYYRKLADANIAPDKSYLDVYQQLTEYYKTKKDHASFADVLAKGRKLYPANEEYWVAIEIEEAVDGVAKPEVFGKYEALMAKNTANYTIPYNYAVELYHFINSNENKNTNTDQYKAKMVEVLKKAIAINHTSEANFIMANFLYNNSVDIADEARKLKGPKPEDLKKKKELNEQSTKVMNDAIPYAIAVENGYAAIKDPKGSQKLNRKQSLIILRNIYEVKKDAAKLAEYEKRVKEIEQKIYLYNDLPAAYG